ncbi:MAG TPA: hypothetical protein DIU15_20785, partial [Deltaproteobacteria bacterium]|nr:hypothetical protein [Deltaproteobacteria bacterium]
AGSTVVADDADCDGSVTTEDCNDTNADIYPGAPEIWDDGIDQDCDGSPDVANASCSADFNVDFPDGSSTTLDGCLDWSQDATFDYDPDDPPEATSLTLNFGATNGVGFDCEIIVQQDVVCGTGYYDATDDDHTTTYALMDCAGVSDEFEQSGGPAAPLYTASTGYLWLETIDTGSEAGSFVEEPLATTMAGYLSVEDGTGVHVSGNFSLTLQQIGGAQALHSNCDAKDGDEDEDGEIDVYFGGTDCDDTDPNNFEDNPEICDGQDND